MQNETVGNSSVGSFGRTGACRVTSVIGSTESRILINTNLQMGQMLPDLSSEGLLTVDSVDGKVVQTFRLQMRPPGPGGRPRPYVCGY